MEIPEIDLGFARTLLSASPRSVYPHAFKMLDTYGLPLVIVMNECDRFGFWVDGAQFCIDAVKAGWSLEHALSVVEEAMTLWKGPFIARKFMPLLQLYVMKQISQGALQA